MELTERCNNNCIHCCINLAAGNEEAKLKELSNSEIKEILKEAASLGCLTVRFTGGEPMLREDFLDLYLYTRKLGFKVLIFTNATLISPKIADVFSRIPPLEKMEVTVYGMTQESYERVTRVRGSYHAFKRGIDLLLANRIPFIVKSALLPANKYEMEAFESWASRIPWTKTTPSYAMFYDLRSRRDSHKKNKVIQSLRLSPADGLKVIAKNPADYISKMRDFCTRFMRPGGSVLFTCGAGLGGGLVDAYGNFQPCMLLRHPEAVYDLKKGTIKAALTTFFPELRKKKAENRDYLLRCAGCFLKGLCEQCPGKSWVEHGTMDTPVEYLCQVAHETARFIGLLEEGERAWEVQDWKLRIQRLSRNHSAAQKTYACSGD